MLQFLLIIELKTSAVNAKNFEDNSDHHQTEESSTMTDAAATNFNIECGCLQVG